MFFVVKWSSGVCRRAEVANLNQSVDIAKWVTAWILRIILNIAPWTELFNVKNSLAGLMFAIFSFTETQTRGKKAKHV